MCVCVCARARASCASPLRSEKEQWKWKYDPATKQGKWVLAESKAEQREREASAQRPRVTMAELEEDQRKAAEKRAAELRRETAKRLKRKQMLAAKKEQEEEERRQQVLDQRRAEIEERRQLMNAGARVKSDDVYFDDMEPTPCFVGEGVMRPAKPAAGEKPGWNSGVGPGSGPPRIGYQPVSLIPPPALPPSKRNRGVAGGAGSRMTTGSTMASGASRRPSDASSCAPSTRNGGSAPRQQRQQAQQQQELNLDDALARADQGIKQARLFSAAAADACSRPESASSSVYSAASRYGRPTSHASERHAQAQAHAHGHDGLDLESGRCSPQSNAPSSIHFWNNKAPCSEGGGGPSVTATPRSAAGGAGGGAYRRKVDALKEQIESLKRVSTAGSVASNASRTSTATASSSRTAYTNGTSVSGRARPSPRPTGAFGNAMPNGRGEYAGAGREARADSRDAPGGEGGVASARPPRINSAASSRYGAPVGPGGRVGAAGGGGGVQFGGVAHTRQVQAPLRGWAAPTLDVHSEGPSRVRGGLAQAREKAALLDSLDLDSPAHRNNAKAEACRHLGDDNTYVDDAQLRQSNSVVESLDLDAQGGGGHLTGLIRADQWLKRAVDSALGTLAPHAKPPQHPCPHQMPPASRGSNFSGRPTDAAAGVGGRQAAKEGPGGVQFAQAHTRKVARPVAAGRPPVSSKSVLRRSAELLKKQSGDTRQLLEQFRNKEPSEGAGCDGLEGRGHRRPYEDRPLRQPQAHSPARSQAEEMHAIQEHIQEVEDEEALLMASLARLDSKLAGAPDPAAAYLAAAEYKDKKQQRHDIEVARQRDARAAPLAVKKLPPAPALDHWNRTEDIQQFQMFNARDNAAFGGGGGGPWEASSNWGTAQSGRRPGAIQKVERIAPSMGAGARDRRALLKNK